MTSLKSIFQVPLLNRLPLSSNSLPTHVYIIPLLKQLRLIDPDKWCTSQLPSFFILSLQFLGATKVPINNPYAYHP